MFTLSINHDHLSLTVPYSSDEQAVEKLFEFAASKRLKVGAGTKTPAGEYGLLLERGDLLEHKGWLVAGSWSILR